MVSPAGLSLIVPVHNEQDQLVSALDTLFGCLESLRSQLVLAVQRAGLGIVEIPVRLADGRPSRMKIVTDGWNAFTELVRERLRRDGV